MKTCLQGQRSVAQRDDVLVQDRRDGGVASAQVKELGAAVLIVGRALAMVVTVGVGVGVVAVADQVNTDLEQLGRGRAHGQDQH